MQILQTANTQCKQVNRPELNTFKPIRTTIGSAKISDQCKNWQDGQLLID
jgi:hypothetical protein